MAIEDDGVDCLDTGAFLLTLNIAGTSTYTITNNLEDTDPITGVLAGELILESSNLATAYSYTVLDESNDNCSLTIEGTADCASGCILSAIPDVTCINGQSYFINLSVNSETTFTIEDGVNAPTTGNESGVILLGPYFDPNFNIVVSADDNPDCFVEIIDSTDCVTDPIPCIPFTVTDSLECDEILGGFVSLTIQGSGTYTIDDGLGTEVSGLTAGSYVFGPIPNIEYNFTVTDESNSNCFEVATGISECLDCSSLLSNFEIDQVYVNFGDSLTMSADFGVLDEGYESGFVMYTDRSDPAGSVIDFSPTGMFENDGSFPTNTDIYISAAILQVPFGSNFDGPCTVISDPFAPNATSVFFLEPITMEYEPVCNDSSNTISLTVTVGGGLPELIGGEYYITGTLDTTYAYDQAFLNIGTFDQDVFIEIQATDDNGGTSFLLAGSGSTICATPNPVTLVEFDGKVQADGNLLYWTTASEYRSAAFIVERSLDAVNFEPIGSKEAAGNSNQALNYELLDEDAPLGLAYYRLLERDLDGDVKVVSRVVVLNRKSNDYSVIGAYPNPTSGTVVLEFNSNVQKDLKIELYDVTGRLLQITDFDMLEGINKLSMDLRAFATGTYYFKVIGADELETIRVVKE